VHAYIGLLRGLRYAMTQHTKNQIDMESVIMYRKTRTALLVILVLFGLSACGSGGGGGGAAPPASRSNWDVLVWDQDSWS
jgi:hypothetical protein